MDSKRFDSFAKAMATWTSRRKVLGGLSSLIGVLVLRPNIARGQTPSPKDECGNPMPLTSQQRKEVVTAASDAVSAMAPATDFKPLEPDTHPIYRARFQGFVQQVRCLLTEEASINPEPNETDNASIRTLFNRSTALVSALSIAYADDHFPLPFDPGTPTPSSGVCSAFGCLAYHLSEELKCEAGCGDDACINVCQSNFFGAIIGAGPNGSDPKSCLTRLYEACGPNCCTGSCTCGYC